jgi:hypothetical protein
LAHDYVIDFTELLRRFGPLSLAGASLERAALRLLPEHGVTVPRNWQTWTVHLSAIVNLTDAEALEAQLGENLQRKDVHPLEEAQAFRALLSLEEPKCSIEQIAARTVREALGDASRGRERSTREASRD